MKIATARIQDREFVGVIEGEKIIDLSFQYPSTLIECIDQIITIDNAPQEYIYQLNEVELLAPIPVPRKNIICVGKNYRDHAIEMGAVDAPEDMIIFTKAPTTVTATNTSVPLYSEITSQLDYEGELAVIIGKKGKAISEEEALDYVFGYTILNDITARDIQGRHKQFFLGKSLDSTCPMGPYIETEIPNPQDLHIETRVNGEIRQQSNSSLMMFNIANIISTISKGMTLEVGDIIATGTPAGVGKGMKPPTFLKSGDIIEIEIDGLGTLTNTIE